jgi:hypothetical protein
MSNVILLINGTEVYNNSTSSSTSTSTTPDVKYTLVKNPTVGEKYYYEEKMDEYNKPVYNESILEEITYEADGPGSEMATYIFKDGHNAKYTIFKRSDSGGGEIQKKKTTKVEKKKKIFQKEILNIINI